MGEGCDGPVPLSDLEVASTEPAMYVCDLNGQHHWALGEAVDDLRVICCCSFELHLGLLAVTHEETPFGVGTHVDEVVLLL